MPGSQEKELLHQAIHLAIKGIWDGSHRIVQDIHSIEAYWIHAVLHKAEGDEFNSRYWYERAGRLYEAFDDPKNRAFIYKKYIYIK